MELENIALNNPCFYREETVPERRFLLWYHPESDGYSVFHVHRHFRNGTYRCAWMAHWSEMHSDGMKIARPRQLYTGYEKRDFKSDIKR